MIFVYWWIGPQYLFYPSDLLLLFISFLSSLFSFQLDPFGFTKSILAFSLFPFGKNQKDLTEKAKISEGKDHKNEEDKLDDKEEKKDKDVDQSSN